MFTYLQHLFDHFSSEGNWITFHSDFLDDVSVIFLDKTDSEDPNKREHYWRHTLKTTAPQGLNVEDDWFLQFRFFNTFHTINSHDSLY